jgi:hypothetical protein
LVRILCGKFPLGNPKRKRDKIKINLSETGCDNMKWSELAQVLVHWWDIVNRNIQPSGFVTKVSFKKST